MLIRQKVITATIISCILIVIFATTAYILAADRIGREFISPKISESFADIFQLQLQQDPENIFALKTLANTMIQNYKIQEIAFYNINKERIIYACSNTCQHNLPTKFDEVGIVLGSDKDTHYIFDLMPLDKSYLKPSLQESTNREKRPFKLIIIPNTGLAKFFYADTVSTALLIVSLSTLLLFFLP